MQSKADTRLRGVWLVLGRMLWSICVAFVLVVLFVNVPQYPAFFVQLQISCYGQACNNLGLSPDALHTLNRFGISSASYALAILTLYIFIPTLVCFAIGGVLAWR